MIHRLVAFSLRNRLLVIGLSLLLGVAGYVAMRTTAVDAIPDLSDNQVVVFTDWAGHGAQEVEDQVTYPLTTSLQGLPGTRVVRSQSAFGFSMIYVILHDDVDLYFARSRVLERLTLVAKQLPEGVTPTLGPDATGVGHVFWYTVESPSHSLTELRSLQDWFIRYQLNSVPGVAEVASVGGHVQQYEVDVDPAKLRAYNIPLSRVVEAVQRSNRNVGGNVLESSGSWTVVRGLGLIEKTEDLERIAVGSAEGVPIFLQQVADVRIGSAFRVASLVKGEQEAVGGVIVARAGANAKAVIDAVKAKLAEIEPGLPEGVRIVPFYDRSDLIEQAVHTLRIALIEEILLVTLAHIIFLRHARSILAVTLPLPLAVLASFLGMRLFGVTSNIMSLAGIAIAIGVLVDAAIVVTENAMRTLEQRNVDTRDRAAVPRAVLDSASLVGRPIFFSMVIILLAFLPVFALTGQEGKLFHPLAFTKTLAVLAAAILSVTLVPVLCSFLLRGKLHREEDNRLMRGLRRAYEPVLRGAIARPGVTLGAAAMLLVSALLLATRIGSEFMPPLHEGDLMFMPIADPSISLDENTRIAARQNAILQKFPEVEYAVAKVGRADTSTDPSPLNMTETVVHLKPRSEWRAGMTPERLRGEMDAALRLPGVANIWTMPIVNRIDMLTTGIRAEVGVKIFGSDLSTLERLASEVAGVLRGVPGATNVYPEQITAGQYLNVRVDREAAARYGLDVGEVLDVIESGIGETPVTTTIEGRRRFPVRVRYGPAFRSDAQSLGDVLVNTPAGSQVPLKTLASFEFTRGPTMISAENGALLATVLLNVQGRPVGTFIDEARRAVTAQVRMPAGYVLSWSGRFENEARARARLQLVLPVVLVVIFLLLWITYHSALEAAHVLLAVPFALTGGIFLVWALGYNFSVAVWVGFIALFGTAVQTAVVMVIYLEEAVERTRVRVGRLTRAALRQAVMEGALLRLRPKVMTVATVVASLLPIMWSARVGAEVMKPLAAPVLGGMVSSLAHVLIVTPVIFFLLRARGLPHEEEDARLSPPPLGRRRLGLVAVVLLIATLAAWLLLDRRSTGPIQADVRQTLFETTAGSIRVAVKSATPDLLRKDTPFVVEFRSAADGSVADVENVRIEGAMPMPGMNMAAQIATEKLDAGRYRASGVFGMAGAWQFTIAWTHGGVPGSVRFERTVQ